MCKEGRKIGCDLQGSCSLLLQKTELQSRISSRTVYSSKRKMISPKASLYASLYSSITSNTTKLSSGKSFCSHAFKRLLGSLRLLPLPFVKINVAIYNLPDSVLPVSWYRGLISVHAVLCSRRLKPLSLAAASIWPLTASSLEPTSSMKLRWNSTHWRVGHNSWEILQVAPQVLLYSFLKKVDANQSVFLHSLCRVFG